MKKSASLIVGNWKSFIPSPKEGLRLLKTIDKGLPRGMKSEVVVCPPALLLAYLRATYKGRRIQLGVQDISLQPQGPHTGEVTAELAKSSGATYAILGHAERRAAGEDDAEVAAEVRTALDAELIPIVCVGEVSRDKDGRFFADIEKTVAASLARVLPHEISRVVVAYEPVWAIGAVSAPDARTVSEATLYVRKTLAALYGREPALKTKILYGGAVDDSSAEELLKVGGIGGFLVGRASSTRHTSLGSYAHAARWGS